VIACFEARRDYTQVGKLTTPSGFDTIYQKEDLKRCWVHFFIQNTSSIMEERL